LIIYWKNPEINKP